MINAKLFSTEEELSSLTTLSHNELWDAGFNLDDWNCGIAVPIVDADAFYESYWPMIDSMNNWCCGISTTEHNGWLYYMMYHA